MSHELEYKIALQEVKKMLKSLNKIGVNPSIYIDEIKEIESSKETDYILALTKLQSLKKELSKYNAYFEIYNCYGYIQYKINSDSPSNEDVSTIIQEIIRLNKIIDKSNISKDNTLVINLYKLTFSIIKMEFLNYGKSLMFDYINTNSQYKEILNKIIKEEIESLPKDKVNSKIINAYVENELKKDSNYSYIDKFLITLLSIESEKDIINRIKEDLNNLVNEFNSNKEEITKINDDILSTDEELAKCTKNYNVILNKKQKQILKSLSSIILSFALIFGSYKIARNTASSKKYKTITEKYSVSDGYEEYTSYEKEIAINNKVYAYESHPYRFIDLLNKYRRYTIKYDITNTKPLDSDLKSYMDIDLQKGILVGEYTEDKSKEEMRTDDYYKTFLIKIERIIQDMDDYEIEYDTGIETFILFTLSFILIPALGVISTDFVSSVKLAKKYYREAKEIGKTKEEILRDLQQKIEVFRRLCANNEEIKERFTSAFNTYKDFISSEEFNNLLEELNTKEYKLDLDSNTSKTLKKVK